MKEITEETSLEQVDASANRETYLDCLRIMATFAVMIAHIASQFWRSLEAETYAWKVFSFYDSIARWSVPAFVMISGALFLRKDQNMERIFKKNIVRIATAFMFWSAIYALVNLMTGKSGIKNALRAFVEGPVHLWFLFMIVGIYLLIPFLRKIVVSMELTTYFVLLSLVFTFALPSTITVISFYSGKIASIADHVLQNVYFRFTLGYVSYFVFGYFFSQINIERKKRWLIYLSGAVGFLVTSFGQVIFPLADQDAAGLFHTDMTFNVMLESVALFTFAKYHLNFPTIPQTLRKFIQKLSAYSFGAYLVHAMTITRLNHMTGLNTLSFDPILSVPAIGVIVFILSFAISGILHQIPVLKKYIV